MTIVYTIYCKNQKKYVSTTGDFVDMGAEMIMFSNKMKAKRYLGNEKLRNKIIWAELEKMYEDNAWHLEISKKEFDEVKNRQQLIIKPMVIVEYMDEDE